MATDSFLKMDNVEGESKDKVHKKEIANDSAVLRVRPALQEGAADGS